MVYLFWVQRLAAKIAMSRRARRYDIDRELVLDAGTPKRARQELASRARALVCRLQDEFELVTTRRSKYMIAFAIVKGKARYLKCKYSWSPQIR